MANTEDHAHEWVLGCISNRGKAMVVVEWGGPYKVGYVPIDKIVDWPLDDLLKFSLEEATGLVEDALRTG